MTFDFAACQQYLDERGGGLTSINVRRLVRPAGLPKPYEYAIPAAKCDAMYVELKTACKSLLATHPLQMLSVDKKGISKGMRLQIFGLTLYDSTLSDADWLYVVETIQAIYHKYLGQDALLYAEPLGERKSQLRHQAYIMYTELSGSPQSPA